MIALANGFCLIGKVNDSAPLSVIELSTGKVTPLCERGSFLFLYDGCFYYDEDRPEEEYTPDHFRFRTATGKTETVYGSAEKFPVGAVGFGIFGETEEEYYYFSTTYYSGAVGGYEKGSPLIVKAKKNEITTPGYHAEITY